MSGDLLNSKVGPKDLPEGKRGRHLGKTPVIIAATIILALLGAMVFGGMARLQQTKGSASQEESPQSKNVLSGTELDGFFNQQPDGFIEYESTQAPDKIQAVENAADLPAEKDVVVSAEPAELTDLEKLYLEFEAKKVKDYVAAFDAPTLVEGGANADSNSGEDTNKALLDSISSTLAAARPAPPDTLLAATNPAALVAATNPAALAAATNPAALAAATNPAVNLLSDSGAADLSQIENLLGGGVGAPVADQNNQAGKLEFLNQEPDATGYLQSTRTDQITPYEIKTGTVIPGVMISGMNSDLPGQIIAQVREDVYDTATGRHLLIPQGTRLYGSYDSGISYGQNRALAVWTRLIYPDGSAQDIGAMGGSDRAGYAGFKDKVNNHYFRIFGSIFLLSVFNALPALVDDNTTVVVSPFPDALESQIVTSTSSVAEEITRRNLDIQPTIVIRPGYKFNVMVNRDIAFNDEYSAFR